MCEPRKCKCFGASVRLPRTIAIRRKLSFSSHVIFTYVYGSVSVCVCVISGGATSGRQMRHLKTVNPSHARFRLIIFPHSHTYTHNVQSLVWYGGDTVWIIDKVVRANCWSNRVSGLETSCPTAIKHAFEHSLCALPGMPAPNNANIYIVVRIIWTRPPCDVTKMHVQ